MAGNGTGTASRRDAAFPPTLKGARVLVLEDNGILAEELRELLQQFECNVIGPVKTAAAAEEVLREQVIEAAVLDINLNGERTFAPADAMRDAGIPFLFISGYSRSSVPERFKDVPFLEKPVVHAELASAVSEAVATSIARRRDSLTLV